MLDQLEVPTIEEWKLAPTKFYLRLDLQNLLQLVSKNYLTDEQ